MNEFLKKKNKIKLHHFIDQLIIKKNHILKISQDVHLARKQEKNLLAEIQGSQNRAKKFMNLIEKHKNKWNCYRIQISRFNKRNERFQESKVIELKKKNVNYNHKLLNFQHFLKEKR
jgi:hypothetical protein